VLGIPALSHSTDLSAEAAAKSANAAMSDNVENRGVGSLESFVSQDNRELA